MARYFFNVFDGKDSFDATGIDLAGTREMRLHMLETAKALLGSKGQQAEIWQMEALDERGEIVGSMDFGLARSEELRKVFDDRP